MKCITNILYLLKIINSIDKKRIIFSIILAVISSLKSLISVLFIKLALDCITMYQSFLYLVVLVLIERTFSITLSFLECQIRWEKCPICDAYIEKKLLEKVFSQSLKIELEKLDNPDFYNMYTRAIDEAKQRVLLMMSSFELFITSLLNVVSLSAIIILLDWKLILLSLASAVISIFLNVRISKINIEKSNNLTFYKRKIDYIRRIFYLPQYLEELKSNNYNKLLFSKLDNSVCEYNEQIKKYESKDVFLQVVNDWQNILINFGLASFVIGEKIINNNLEMASFTSLVYASVTLSSSLSSLFAIVPQMVQHSLFINNLREVLEYKSSMKSADKLMSVKKEKNHSIVLENVSFKYNSSVHENLKNITLRINKGEKIALVGENGAGKTTLIKLILRLYDPQKGELFFDGENYQNLKVDSLRDEISVVFQNYQPFAFSIGENVLMREMKKNEDEYNVWEALKKSGLYSKIKELPDNLYTPLTNEFEENGINLSGGETQKLAITKAIYKEAGVIIMDEPTSSLDPASEHEMYMHMFDMCKDKTLILISHRLYSTKMVDKIYYMEKGSIVECGNHEELMKLNGKYANLYNIQAKHYR